MIQYKRRLQTLGDHLAWGERAFVRAKLYFGHGTDNAADESFRLASAALGSRNMTTPRRTLTEAQSSNVLKLFHQRIRTRKPAAYLTGVAHFAGIPFHVDERVLIPRSPIAELIEQRFRPWLQVRPTRALDLCAGSGCIGIACAKNFLGLKVDLAELDPGALEVCNLNIRRHRLAGRVRALQSDLFQSLEGQRYELIVSNPPYVPTAEWRSLPLEYHREPRLALEAGRDGMTIVARILDQASNYLKPRGLLVCEIGGSMREFERRFPRLPALWPEFERGGDGVFIISREELITWKKSVR